MLSFFAPHHVIELLSLILLALPKQVLYQIRMAETNLEQLKFWNRLLESSPGSQLLEEITLLRYHLGIQSEYCHISNFSDEQDQHEFLPR